MLHHEINTQPTGFFQKMFRSMREVVFGLEDGMVSTLGAITGIAASTNNAFFVILSGFVIISVEALSMSAGTFLSSKSDREMQKRMLEEEMHEIETEPEKEREELVHFYTSRGFTAEETAMVVARVTSDKNLWLEEMAYRELGVIPSNAHETPVLDAVFMGVSYIIGGFIPLFSYFFLPVGTALYTSIGFSLVGLFVLGYTKGKIVHTNKIKSGIEMMVVSLSAAGIGYIVGQVVSYFM